MSAWERLAEAVPVHSFPKKGKEKEKPAVAGPAAAKKNPIPKAWADKPGAAKAEPGKPIQLSKVWSTKKPTAAQGALAAMDQEKGDEKPAGPEKSAPADDPKPVPNAEVFRSPRGMYIVMNGQTFFLNPKSMRALGKGDDMLGHHDRGMAGLGESPWAALDRMINEGR